MHKRTENVAVGNGHIWYNTYNLKKNTNCNKKIHISLIPIKHSALIIPKDFTVSLCFLYTLIPHT